MRHAFVLPLLFAATACQKQQPAPITVETVDAGTIDAGLHAPVARRTPVSTTLHGETRVDEYAWMKEKGTPELEAHLHAENAYTDAMLAPQQALRTKLEAEILGRRPQVIEEFPERYGNFEYWSRSDLREQFEKLLRRPLDGGSEELLLDLNTLAPDASYVNLLDFSVSDDDARLAWAIDTSGSREFTLHVTELDGGARWPLEIPHVTSFDWAADGKTLFFTTENDAKRSSKLFRLEPGADAGVLLVEENDEHFDLSVRRSFEKRFLWLESTSLTTSETSALDARTPKGTFSVVLPRVQEQRYEVHARGADFVIVSQDQGAEGRVFSVPMKNPKKGKRTEWVPRREGVPIEGATVLEKFLVVWERLDGQSRPRAIEWATRTSQDFGSQQGTFTSLRQHSFDSTRFLYGLESPAQPPAVFERELLTGETKKRWELPVNGFDSSSVEVLRVLATAKDGTKIPITLARKKTTGPNAPMLLQAYGAYGDPTEPGFGPWTLALLERGVVVAYAHVRGGGEFGDAWHDAGRLKNKLNTFTDFIACAEFLIAEKFTIAEKLNITGGSAGGLLMGGVLNMRPELFHAALVEVPFVDVITTMLDTSLPLTVGEFEEWGDPREAQAYSWMRAYSPYDNVKAQPYPSILVRSSYNDTQVLFHEPAKWVQRLRTTRTDERPVLLWMSMDPAGHGGRTALTDVTRDDAKAYGWLLSEWGITR
jgi:oligopeptidase B